MDKVLGLTLGKGIEGKMRKNKSNVNERSSLMRKIMFVCLFLNIQDFESADTNQGALCFIRTWRGVGGKILQDLLSQQHWLSFVGDNNNHLTSK